MKKLLVVLVIALLFGCEKSSDDCWICTVKVYKALYTPPGAIHAIFGYVDEGTDIFCDKKPKSAPLNSSGRRYTCNKVSL